MGYTGISVYHLECPVHQLLLGVKFTVCWLDDILISGSSPEEHLQILEEVFGRLQDQRIRLIPAKCIFFQPGLELLGHWIDQLGFRPLPQKMEAIMEISSPRNVTELKSYLWLLDYYGKFLPNLATILHPLHDLLQKDRTWKWTEACESAFVKSKQQLIHLFWSIMTLKNHFAWPVMHHPMGQGL